MSKLISVPLNDQKLVRALRAIADPARFRMVQEIAAAGELSDGELAEHFDVSQPTVSNHLKILADAEILLLRAEGKRHYTSINRPLLKRVIGLLPRRLPAVAKEAAPKNKKKSRSKPKKDIRGKD